MNTIMFIQNIEYSYIVVSKKYTHFINFFFSWDGECDPGKINTNLWIKISDDNSSTLIPKYLHIQGKIFL